MKKWHKDVFHLTQVQESAAEWYKYNFGKDKPHHNFLGVVEEIGELAHATLKMEQGIRGTKEEHMAKIKDASADIVIFLCQLATAHKFDLESEVIKAWDEVKFRDWKKYPGKGKA